MQPERPKIEKNMYVRFMFASLLKDLSIAKPMGFPLQQCNDKYRHLTCHEKRNFHSDRPVSAFFASFFFPLLSQRSCVFTCACFSNANLKAWVAKIRRKTIIKRTPTGPPNKCQKLQFLKPKSVPTWTLEASGNVCERRSATEAAKNAS